MKNKKITLLFIALLNVFSFQLLAQTQVVYDIVLAGGRVIDPETKLDAIKNVGIINNRIAEISSEPLKGKETINAKGLVVSPGFIDLHVHRRRFKGRMQVGADADITIFNPNTIIDKGTFENGPAFSAGIEYVMVNAVVVLRNGKTVNNVFTGQAVYGKFKN